MEKGGGRIQASRWGGLGGEQRKTRLQGPLAGPVGEGLDERERDGRQRAGRAHRHLAQRQGGGGGRCAVGREVR